MYGHELIGLNSVHRRRTDDEHLLGQKRHPGPQELAQKVSLGQLHVGIGSTNRITHKWDYKWDETKFEVFMAFLRDNKVRLWRTDIDTLNATN